MMTVQALYRKWRPQTFDEVIGQSHVVDTLCNALTSGRIHHAYLFAGPRGTGKTTSARLLAKAVNCLAPEDQRPCNDCRICQAINEGRLIDLMEIDAASNTGVDDVRELRERVGFRPNEARYKVYVIDEVHMLSTSAFNALLKTLEEPPPHAIFVLATTEAHKIPNTVISRCQRFNFRRISVGEVVERLEWMVQQEGIPAEREALTIIARQATGSMRDAESLLDQLASYGDQGISVVEVRAALGIGANEAIVQLAQALIEGNVARGLNVINTAIDEGADPRQFARQVVEYLRALLLLQFRSGVLPNHVTEDLRPRLEEQARAADPRFLTRAVRLFNQAVNEAKSAWQPQLPLEMALIEAALPAEPASSAPVSHHQARSPSSPTSSSSSSSSWLGTADTKHPADTKPHKTASYTPSAPRSMTVADGEHPADRKHPADNELLVESSLDRGDGSLTPEGLSQRWPEFLNDLRPRNMSLEALMRSSQPLGIEEDVIILGFDYEFHRGKVEEDHNRQEVENVLSKMVGQRYRVRCVLQREDGPTETKRHQPSHAAPDPSPRQDVIQEDPVVKMAVEDLGAQVVMQ
ncbi:MAG TPA: DNA polymerase III subunit gamma/tau [Chloroflexi bacterium]|nr:DNA polymerase III subunit gamma/tau [Chloroflexota bacterium]